MIVQVDPIPTVHKNNNVYIAVYYVGKEFRLLHVYMHTIIKIILYIEGHVANNVLL